ncbi:methionine--tRNA ligase, partial [Candidatus Dependentiae bacterium]
MKNNKFYITTPLYYVNSKPHLGTLYTTLIADAIARWQKLCGKDVFFLTGTDEHGQKIAETAEKHNKKPKEFVDSMLAPFQDTWKKYEIEYNKFIRTTDKDHQEAVTKWVKTLQNNSDIYKSVYTGWYCVPCESYVTVDSEGTKDDKDNYLCPNCKRILKEISEESYFFRLSAYQDQLLEFYENNPHFITPKERLNEVISFVKSGLNDLSISRKNVKWGIPFPGDKGHTIYVWGDALNNYISAIGYGKDDKKSQENFNYWWPANLQLLGKDIIRFHAVYWPAFLIAAGLKLPKKLLVHGFILSDGEKMSKSIGNVMDPNQLADWYGVEQIRYYLLRQMPITQDGLFSLKDVENRISGDLANNLGNLLNRTVTLALNNDLKKVGLIKSPELSTLSLKDKCEEAFRNFWDEMNHNHLHIALSGLWKFISEVNAFFHHQKPWEVAKKDKEFFEEIISGVCHSLYSIAVLLWPIMPKKMELLLQSIGHNFDLKNNYEEILRKNEWNLKFKLTKTKDPLFIRPESHVKEIEKTEEKIAEKQTEYIDINDFSKVQLHVGKIIECNNVKGSKKLYKMQVDFGNLGVRQILAGVAVSFKPDELIGNLGVYVLNLKPR